MNNLHLDLNLNNLSENDKEKLLALVEKAQTKKSFNPFERVDKGDSYYYIDDEGLVKSTTDEYSFIDDAAFNSHIYYNNATFAEHQALRELLNRKLMKFSYENGGADIEINKSHRIYYNTATKDFFITGPLTYSELLTPLFISKEVAQRAIEEVIKPFMKEHPNFKWWG